MDGFMQWFECEGGSLDSTAMGIADFPGQGRGGVALRDIPEGHIIFGIPRSLTLSTRTCELPRLLGQETWRRYGLHKGWVGLILCMMWEEAKGTSSRWSDYLASLPRTFDTPMFWDDVDLVELKGTAIADKIGRNDAQRDYNEKILPIVLTHTELFAPEHLSQFYSLEMYHMMGSRILSRSFHVEKWDGSDDEDSDTNEDDNAGSMDVDEEQIPVASAEQAATTPNDQDSDEGDVEDPSDVAMVPMADILNARYGCENAKLFYEEKDLKMIATKPIPVGEQIWNTYGDPPNSDLLRRYGHVDVIALPDGQEGNPADVVEVRADLVLETIRHHGSNTSGETYKERIDWWLEEGGDDTFVLERGSKLPVPEIFISFVRLLMFTEDWERARDKNRLPKTKMDSQVFLITISTLRRRLDEYPTNLQMTREMLAHSNQGHLSLNKKHALIIRAGEQMILHDAIRGLESLQRVSGSREHKDQGTKRTGDGKPADDRSARRKRSKQ